MAGGWAPEGNVQQQIDSTVDDAVRHARRQLHSGPSLYHCEECGEPIPEARRQAVPGVRLCIDCQAKWDGSHGAAAVYNRRASKGSQLR